MLLSPQLIVPRPRPIVVAAGGGTTSWNPADKATNLALSNSNLTVTSSAAGFLGVRSVASASSGKKYWEVVPSTASNVTQNGVQAANVSASLTTFNDANGIGWFGDGKVYQNGGIVNTIQTWAQGDTLCVALDIDNKRIWFKTNAGAWNNSGANDPATNTGGIDTSAIAGALFALVVLDASGDVFTANFGGSADAFTPPSGFTNW